MRGSSSERSISIKIGVFLYQLLSENDALSHLFRSSHLHFYSNIFGNLFKIEPTRCTFLIYSNVLSLTYFEKSNYSSSGCSY